MHSARCIASSGIGCSIDEKKKKTTDFTDSTDE
jgi:hypothetical protein